MPWVKLDDAFADNRKVRRLWHRCPAAVGLHVMALTHSSRQHQDGFVDPEWVVEKLGNTRNRERCVKALVEAGLWEEWGDGHQIHHFLEYNPSAEKVASIREARRLAGAMGGRRSGQGRRSSVPVEKRSRAANMANTALKAGRIEHGPCEVCGQPGKEMHHDDYDVPLAIRWFCRAHHTEHHREQRAKQKASTQ